MDIELMPDMIFFQNGKLYSFIDIDIEFDYRELEKIERAIKNREYIQIIAVENYDNLGISYIQILDVYTNNSEFGGYEYALNYLLED